MKLLKVLALILLYATVSHATTYYIAANGADTNNGTTKATPWLHSPGMNGCASNCAAYSHVAGDRWIFRGGDTWHFGNSGSAPYIGGATWTYNSFAGTSATCNPSPIVGTGVDSGCDYVGVDFTYFSGGSWTRPIMSGDNAFTTSYAGTCPTRDFSGVNITQFGGSAVIFDNFEWSGFCWSTTGSPAPPTQLGLNGSRQEAENQYFHGWSLASVATQDQSHMIGCNGTGCGATSLNYVHDNVFDGQDSSLGTTNDAATGFALGGGYPDIAYNVFYRTTNGLIGTNVVAFHDNNFYYSIEPKDSTHGNTEEPQGEPACNTYLYDNAFQIIDQGQGNDMFMGDASVPCAAYVFNNIESLYRPIFAGSVAGPNNNTNNGNCYFVEDTGGSGNPKQMYFFQNTTAQGCAISGKNITLSSAYQSLHNIGCATNTIAGCLGPLGTVVDNGNQVYQTLATANGQGYNDANLYAPTSGTNATVGTGMTAAAGLAICNGISSAPVAAACKSGYGGVTYNQVNHTVTHNTAIVRPTTGNWDAGAWQFSGSSGPTTPAPATTMFSTLIVQPLPAQASAPSPTLTKSAPANTYLSPRGFSQDGVNFSSTLSVALTGTNLNVGAATCTLDGTKISCNCSSSTLCSAAIPASAVAIPTKATAHSLGIQVAASAPAPIPVIQ